EKKINTVVQYVVRRNAELADVPAVVELAGDDSQRKILALFASGAEIGRSIVAPPGLPAAILQSERAAFDPAMADSDFLEDVRKSGLDFDPMPGLQLQDIVENVGNVPADVVAAARRLYESPK